MPRMPRPTRPVGLYDPQYEHDACGVAFVARLNGEPSHETVRRAVVALANLEHRGAAGADPNTGDGAGILLQMPDAFLRQVVDFELAPAGRYGVLVCFLPTNDRVRAKLEGLAAHHSLRYSQSKLGHDSSKAKADGEPNKAMREDATGAESPAGKRDAGKAPGKKGDN